MIVSSSNLRRRGITRSIFLRRLLALILLVATAWCVWVYQEISAVASEDDAQPADAIAVFGAAEYSGHPSPVLHARLDHAVHLFRIRELCKDAGLEVYTSPRPALGHISNYDMAMRYFHEIVSYTALRLNL